MPRLFVAAWPPGEVLDVLAALPRHPRTGVRFTTRAQWHITLRFLGEVDEEAATAALADIRFARSPVVMGPRVERLAPDVVVAPLDGLDEVASAVRAATATLGPAPEPHSFRGHITLARTKKRQRCSLDDAAVAATFTVDRLALVHSELHPDGARYRTVASVTASA